MKRRVNFRLRDLAQDPPAGQRITARLVSTAGLEHGPTNIDEIAVVTETVATTTVGADGTAFLELTDNQSFANPEAWRYIITIEGATTAKTFDPLSLARDPEPIDFSIWLGETTGDYVPRHYLLTQDELRALLAARGTTIGLTEVMHDASLTGEGTAADELGIADDGVQQRHIADDAVGTAQIQSGAVTEGELSQTTQDKVNARADWNATSGPSFIENKPTIPPAPPPRSGAFTQDFETKLEGIEVGATADQTPAEIRDALAGLQTTNRLPASAIRDLPDATVHTGPTISGDGQSTTPLQNRGRRSLSALPAVAEFGDGDRVLVGVHDYEKVEAAGARNVLTGTLSARVNGDLDYRETNAGSINIVRREAGTNPVTVGLPRLGSQAIAPASRPTHILVKFDDHDTRFVSEDLLTYTPTLNNVQDWSYAGGSVRFSDMTTSLSKPGDTFTLQVFNSNAAGDQLDPINIQPAVAKWVPVSRSGVAPLPQTGADPSDAAPLQDGTAAPGTSDDYSRGDHVHPHAAPTRAEVYDQAKDIIVGSSSVTVTQDASKRELALTASGGGSTPTGSSRGDLLATSKVLPTTLPANRANFAGSNEWTLTAAATAQGIRPLGNQRLQLQVPAFSPNDGEWTGYWLTAEVNGTEISSVYLPLATGLTNQGSTAGNSSLTTEVVFPIVTARQTTSVQPARVLAILSQRDTSDNFLNVRSGGQVSGTTLVSSAVAANTRIKVYSAVVRGAPGADGEDATGRTADTQAGQTFPPDPEEGDRFILTTHEDVHRDRAIEITQPQVTLREGRIGAGVGLPASINVYGATTGPIADLANKVYLVFGGARTKTARQIWLYREGESSSVYTVSQSIPTGRPHFYQIQGLTYDDVTPGAWRFNVLFTDGTKLYPDQPFELGDYVYDTDAGWIFAPGVAAPWAVQGQPEPRTLAALTSLIDGPMVGLASVGGINRNSGLQLFSPTFDLDDDDKQFGTVQVTVEARLTPSGTGSTTVGFDTNTTHPLRVARLSNFVFASDLRALTNWDISQRNGIVIGSIVVRNGSATLGTYRVYLARNTAGQLGYVEDYQRASGSVSLSFAGTMRAAFSHQDGVESTGGRTPFRKRSSLGSRMTVNISSANTWSAWTTLASYTVLAAEAGLDTVRGAIFAEVTGTEGQRVEVSTRLIFERGSGPTTTVLLRTAAYARNWAGGIGSEVETALADEHELEANDVVRVQVRVRQQTAVSRNINFEPPVTGGSLDDRHSGCFIQITPVA